MIGAHTIDMNGANQTPSTLQSHNDELFTQNVKMSIACMTKIICLTSRACRESVGVGRRKVSGRMRIAHSNAASEKLSRDMTETIADVKQRVNARSTVDVGAKSGEGLICCTREASQLHTVESTRSFPPYHILSTRFGVIIWKTFLPQSQYSSASSLSLEAHHRISIPLRTQRKTMRQDHGLPT